MAALAWTDKPPLLDGLSFSRIVLDSKGGILKISHSEDQKYRLRVNLDAIASELVKATLFYEDRHFYAHPGVNPLAILRAILSIPGGRRMGASTITMQAARLRYNLKTTTISGKLRQIWLALVLERHYSKKEILEAYFNLAPYGGNVESIEAAARVYFNKAASALTDLESHALAVIPQNPGARNPVNGSREFQLARARLEKSMGGKMAHETELPALHARKRGDLPFLAPHLSLELLANNREAVIRAGIERDLQIMLDNAIKSFVKRGKRHGINNASALLVDCESMRVCALTGSASFYDAAISGQVDGSRAKRSPGSTLKPFIYALALDQGIIHPMSILADTPKSFGGYDPENFDRGFRGPVPAHEALKASRNLPAISLAESLAWPGLYGFLEEAGIKLPRDAGHYGLALALGGAEISMRKLAELYAMLANKGLWQPLRLYDNDAGSPPRRLLSPEAAWLTLRMLWREDEDGGLIYKTGTSNGFRDAWTAGLAGRYALVVWVGNFDNQSNPFFVGATAALPLYREIVEALAAKRRLAPFAQNPPPELSLEKTRVCSATGDLDRGRCSQTEETWLITSVSPTKDSGILRPVLIDRETGLRACQPDDGNTEEIWMEFWPSEMSDIFATAGIHKPAPPEWLPQCSRAKNMVASKPPSIILPKKNVVYQRKISGESFQIPLMASADSEADKIHWYSGSRYLGSSRPGEILFWNNPGGGAAEIMAVDNLGASVKRKCLIQALP